MRTYGRDPQGRWIKVQTDDNGFNDAVWLTTLVQTLKLNPEESPFYADKGVPAYGSVIQQILPTYYVTKVQQDFAEYFTSLQITLVSDDPPVYNVNAVTKAGAQIITEVAV